MWWGKVQYSVYKNEHIILDKPEPAYLEGDPSQYNSNLLPMFQTVCSTFPPAIGLCVMRETEP